jgi:hypothetical protein
MTIKNIRHFNKTMDENEETLRSDNASGEKDIVVLLQVKRMVEIKVGCIRPLNPSAHLLTESRKLTRRHLQEH